MTSSELTKLKKEYQAFRNNIFQMITYNTNALNKIEGSDILLKENYSINNNSADGDYLNRSITTINETLSDLKSILTTIDNKIRSLNRQIEIAEDKEAAAILQQSSTTSAIK